MVCCCACVRLAEVLCACLGVVGVLCASASFVFSVFLSRVVAWRCRVVPPRPVSCCLGVFLSDRVVRCCVVLCREQLSVYGGPSGLPAPRERHITAVVNDRLIVFGGRGDPDSSGDGGPYLNDVWELDPGIERFVPLSPCVVFGQLRCDVTISRRSICRGLP